MDFHNGVQDYVMFCSTYALSHKGKCFSFSDEADGIALGEGMAAVVLKRLEDAEADGDKIYGVIKGIAGSSDGKSQGLTAPRREGQKTALTRAYLRSGLSPLDVGLVEAHGTGTVAGDRTELAALEDVYKWSGAQTSSVALGTVKTQIGHTKCAAGIASLIKCALATRYGVLPPTLNIATPNQHYDAASSPFALNHRAIPWLTSERVAGVSSFGFGGTNYHAVLTAPEVENSTTELSAAELSRLTPNLRSYELFLFAGETLDQAIADVANMAQFIDQSTRRLSLASLSLSLSAMQALENSVAIQIAIVAESVEDLRQKLTQAQQKQAVFGGVFIQAAIDKATKGNTTASKGDTSNELAFLFAGQGSQFVDMGRELFNYFPELRHYVHSVGSLAAKWFPNTVHKDQLRDQQLAEITATEVAQPLIGSLSYAIVHLLHACGINAPVLAGHSYGELAAVGYAGGFKSDQLVSISQARAQSIVTNNQKDGGMLAVNCDPQHALQLLQQADAIRLEVANINKPSQTVLAGTLDNIHKAEQFFNAEGVTARQINTAIAFHSELITGADEHFGHALTALKDLSMEAQVWSNLTAKVYDKDADTVRKTLTKQLVSPVQYQSMIEGMYEQGSRVFIEVGPGAIQTQFVNEILGDKSDVIAISTLQKNQNALQCLLQALAQLAVAGVELDCAYLYAHRDIEEYDLTQPLNYAESAWLVDGQYARPANGSVPNHGYQPELANNFRLPDTLGESSFGGSTTAHSREAVMTSYLSTLNHFVDQQKEVMMHYLGVNGSLGTNAITQHDHHVSPVADASALSATQQHHSPQPVGHAVSTIVPTPSQYRLEDITALVVQSIATKTGYPTDMIDLQLDLESDLGIDSIKRMELLASLAEELNVPLEEQAIDEEGGDATQLLKEVAGLKSAAQIAQWMYQILQNVQRDSDAIAVMPNSASSSGAASSVYTSEADVLSQVVRAIATKTGYPESMIEPDLNLESDLGIDSIKRMEMLASLAEQMNLSVDTNSIENEHDSTELLQEVAKLQTAADIAAWLSMTMGMGEQQGQSTEPHTQRGQVNSELGEVVPLKPNNDFQMVRFETHYLPCHFDACDSAVLGRHILVVSDINVAGLVAELQAKKQLVTQACLNDFSGVDCADIDAVIFVLDESNDSTGSSEQFSRIFSSIKQLNPEALVSLTVISYCQHLSQTDEQTGDSVYQRPIASTGLSGLVAALRREWPAVAIRSFYEHGSMDEKHQSQWVEHLYVEHSIDTNSPVYMPAAFLNGVRYRRQLVETQFQSDMQATLDKESVLVVIGGAKGITQCTVADVAKKYGCHMVLVGRSNVDEDDVKNLDVKDSHIIRRELIQHYSTQSENNMTLAKIEALIAAETNRHQIVAGIREIQGYANSVRYFSADTNDETQLTAVINDIIKQYKTITGCIYGAGLIKDKFIADKALDDAQAVYTVKTAGYKRFVESVMRVSEPKFIIAYSSISAIYGSRGQTDYGAANDALENTSLFLSRRFPRTRFSTIGWGPWTGVGMVDAALEEHLNKNNVFSIERTEGAQFLLDEIESSALGNTCSFAIKQKLDKAV